MVTKKEIALYEDDGEVLELSVEGDGAKMTMKIVIDEKSLTIEIPTAGFREMLEALGWL